MNPVRNSPPIGPSGAPSAGAISNGVNNLEKLLDDSRGKKALFMAHMIAGYPSVRESHEVAKALVKGGADIIEVQIPFSDPMADGPTIAVACEQALKKGASVTAALDVIKAVAKLKKPVVVMSYINPIYRMGIANFIETISKAGASGLIVPDCPVDTMEGWSLLATCKAADICLIPVVSPGVPRERLDTIAKTATGFWYCTSRQGITGATSVFASDLPDFLKELRNVSDLPVGVGFGVKSQKDVKDLSLVADVVIAGSVFVAALKKSKKASSVEKTMRSLAA